MSVRITVDIAGNARVFFFDILVDICLKGHMQHTLGKLTWILIIAVHLYVLRFYDQ